ncbi:MAG: dockerin type I domain-containing protein [Armatimonadota bacterium]|nr:dockerin type I domain-containing protein [Armatimonadota bacterium]
MTVQQKLLFSTALACAALFASLPSPAQTFTVGGYSWDVANGPTRVLPVVPSQVSGFRFFNTTFLNDQPAFDPNKTLGRIMTGTTGVASFVELGDAVTRKTILVDWAGKRLPNRAGEDFVVYEVGSPGAPEAFMVAVRKKGETTFSAWRYEFANSFTASYNVFATAFNLSDFGLQEGDTIDAILIANLIETDRVDAASGQGNVYLGGGAGFVPVQGPQSNTPSQPYPVDRFDADIVYVAALHPILPPNVAIRGTVSLGDFGGDVTQVPVEVELRRDGQTLRTEQVSLDANGRYTLADVPAGTYDIAFKASHWLRAVVRGVVVTGAADVTGVDVSLTNGDVDGDNEVSLLDFGALVAAFGSGPGGDNWNPNADLDGDEDISLLDFGILVQNFGAVGDE